MGRWSRQPTTKGCAAGRRVAPPVQAHPVDTADTHPPLLPTPPALSDAARPRPAACRRRRPLKAARPGWPSREVARHGARVGPARVAASDWQRGRMRWAQGRQRLFHSRPASKPRGALTRTRTDDHRPGARTPHGGGAAPTHHPLCTPRQAPRAAQSCKRGVDSFHASTGRAQPTWREASPAQPDGCPPVLDSRGGRYGCTVNIPSCSTFRSPSCGESACCAAVVATPARAHAHIVATGKKKSAFGLPMGSRKCPSGPRVSRRNCCLPVDTAAHRRRQTATMRGPRDVGAPSARRGAVWGTYVPTEG